MGEEQYRFNTWGEIAHHLGVSIRTAQNLEKKDGLPIHRAVSSERAPVWAYRQELEDWKRRQSDRKATQAEAVSHSIANVPAAEGYGMRRLLPLAVVVLVAAGVALFFTYKDMEHNKQPAAVTVRGSSILVSSAMGVTLWTHAFPGIAPIPYGEDQVKRWAIGDIFGDQAPEILFIYFPANVGAVGCTLFCFSAEGKILWQFQQSRIVETASRKFVPPYFIGNVQILPPLPGSPGRVLVRSNHYLTYPNQVAVLDGRGNIVGEYWHLGHLLSVAQGDLGRTGSTDVLLGGIDNTHRQATLVVLDPSKIVGAVRSSQQGPLQLANLPMAPAGVEKAIVRFPKSCIVKSEQHNQVKDVRVTQDRVVAVVIEGPDRDHSPGESVYELDFGLNAMAVILDPRLRQNYHELDAAERRGCPLEPEEFKRQVAVTRGADILAPQQ